MAQLRYEPHKPIEFIGAEIFPDTKRSKMRETALHKHFAPHRIGKSEWFKINVKQLLATFCPMQHGHVIPMKRIRPLNNEQTH